MNGHDLSVGSHAGPPVKRIFAILQSTNYFGQNFIEFFLCCRLAQIIQSDFSKQNYLIYAKLFKSQSIPFILQTLSLKMKFLPCILLISFACLVIFASVTKCDAEPKAEADPFFFGGFGRGRGYGREGGYGRGFGGYGGGYGRGGYGGFYG